MVHCWEKEPNDRPSFHQLEQDIVAMVEQLEHATGNNRRNIQSTYVNVSECANYHYHDDLDKMRARAKSAEPESEL
jgi:hypothetical protein